MSFHETRVAIAAALTGLVLATGIGAAATATPPPSPPAAATASQLVDAPATGVALNQTLDVGDGG
jgi:hypothetical protein